jgi:hypothetical protein
VSCRSMVAVFMTRSFTVPKPIRSTVTRLLIHGKPNWFQVGFAWFEAGVVLAENERERPLLGFQKREQRCVALLASEVDRTFAG